MRTALLVKDRRGVARNGPEPPGDRDLGVGAVLRAGIARTLGENLAARNQDSVDLRSMSLHPPAYMSDRPEG